MSRREQIKLTEAEIHDYLRDSKTVIIVTMGPGGYPHPMPMWFVLDDDGAIRMTTFRASQKVKNIQRDPRVSLLVESGDEYAQLKGVVLSGKAELIDDVDTVLRTLRDAALGASPPSPDTGASAGMNDAVRNTAAKRVVIRLEPERVVSWDHSKLGGVY